MTILDVFEGGSIRCSLLPEDSCPRTKMAQYQVRVWRGWHHHMSLVCLAPLFMDETKARHRESLPLLSYRDITELLDYSLPRRSRDEAEVHAQNQETSRRPSKRPGSKAGQTPLRGEGAEDQAQGLGGEIGPPGFVQDEEAAELHYELETMGARDGLPADCFIAALKMPGAGTSNEHRDNVSIFQNELTERVAGLPPGPQKVFFIEQLMSQFPIGRSLRDGDLESWRFWVGLCPGGE